MSINSYPKTQAHQPIITPTVGMRTSSKNKRTLEQKLECLRKAISNSKEHILAGDPLRIYSQYMRYALDQFIYLNFFTSAEANGLDRQYVIHEHVIPHRIVMKKLLDLHPLTDENIMFVLKRYYIICKITKEEDGRLSNVGLKKKMPPEWNEEDGCVFARYKHREVNIEILKNQ